MNTLNYMIKNLAIVIEKPKSNRQKTNFIFNTYII